MPNKISVWHLYDHLLHSFCHFRVVHVVWEFASSTDFVEVCFCLSRLTRSWWRCQRLEPKGLVFSWPQNLAQEPISPPEAPPEISWFLFWILRLPPAEKPLKGVGRAMMFQRAYDRLSRSPQLHGLGPGLGIILASYIGIIRSHEIRIPTVAGWNSKETPEMVLKPCQ